jgi:hypothetical protein
MVLLFVIPCSATVTTNYQLSDTVTTNEIKYDNQVQSEFLIIDSSDAIVSMYIDLENSGYTNNTGILINFEKNLTYSLTTNKYYYLYVIPYMDVTQKIAFQEYVVYNKTVTSINLLPMNIIIDYRYNPFNAQLTSIGICNKASSCTMEMSSLNTTNTSLNYNSDKYLGLPSMDVLMTSIQKFDVTIKYMDTNTKLELDAKKNRLSAISSIIYKILNGVWKLLTFNLDAESEGIINLLLVLDELFLVIGVLILAIFTYPYLVIVWILILGNFFVSWKSTSLREIMFNYSDYMKWVASKTYILAIQMWNLIIKLIHAIKG